MATALLDVQKIATGIETYLERTGEIFRAFRRQDSGCISYTVEAGGQCFFVKHSEEPRGIESLRRAEQVYTLVHHPALPRLYNVIETAAGLALVLEWLPGENLYDYTVGRGKAARDHPHSPGARFRALPIRSILEALDTIYAVHLEIARRGFIAVDFYDGCILYDFERSSTHLCDLDEYRPGPFTVETDRLPGSRRFMAPEEFQRGARIDQVTNVFTLGRTALQFLGDWTQDPSAWRGGEEMRLVILRATDPQRKRRYPGVQAFVEQWRKAVENDLIEEALRS